MPQDPFYSSAKWRDCRATYLRLHPFCSVCAAIGIQTRAVEVDHVKSIRSGGHPFAHANLDGKCKKHHSQKTIYIDGRHKASNNPLVITGVDGFPIGDAKGMYGHKITKIEDTGEEDSPA